MTAFLERFLFSNYIYSEDIPTVFPKKLLTGFIYSMNITKEQSERVHVPGNARGISGRKTTGNRIYKPLWRNTARKWRREVPLQPEKDISLKMICCVCSDGNMANLLHRSDCGS